MIDVNEVGLFVWLMQMQVIEEGDQLQVLLVCFEWGLVEDDATEENTRRKDRDRRGKRGRERGDGKTEEREMWVSE